MAKPSNYYLRSPDSRIAIKNMEETKVTTPEVVKDNVKKTKKVIVRNLLGKEMDVADYFFNGTVLPSFDQICGKPVDREDLIEAFHKVFKPEHNFLFYKLVDKEVYLIIVPLKYSTTISRDHDSIDGDFQKHAISFINEGSVNVTTLIQKLKRILTFVNFSQI